MTKQNQLPANLPPKPQLPGLPDWVPPTDTGISPATDLNDLSEYRRQTVASENTAIPTAYGRDQHFGSLCVLHISDDGFLYVAYGFCEGEIEEFETIYMDNVDIDAADGFLSLDDAEVESYTGTQTQTASPLLSAAISGFTSTYPGLAYLVFKVPQEASQGFPRVSAVIKGKKVFDPRKYNLLHDDQADPLLLTLNDDDLEDAAWFGTDLMTTTPASEGWSTWISGTGPVYPFVGRLISENDDDSNDLFSHLVPCDPTKVYTVRVWVQQSTGDRTNYLSVAFKDREGDRINNSSTPVSDATGWGSIGTNHYWTVVNATFPATWTEYVFTFGAGQSATLPSNAEYLQIGGLFSRTGTTATTIEVSDYRVFEGVAADEQSTEDPTTWTYSTNPSRCFSDFCRTFTDWELMEADLERAIDFNDEDVGGAPRHQLGLTMYRPKTAEQWAAGFRAYTGCIFAPEGGKLRLIPEQATVTATGSAFFDLSDATSAISIADDAALNFTGSDDFTVEAWVNIAAISGVQALVSKQNNVGSAGTGYSLAINANGDPIGYVSDGVLASEIFDTPSGISVNEWHHVAMVVDRTADTLTVYLDGEAGTSLDISSIGDTTNTVDLQLGNDATGTNVLNGSLDEVRLWGTARTQSEIQDNLYVEIDNPEFSELRGYWKLNERVGATAADSSVFALGGTLVGGAGFSTSTPDLLPANVAREFAEDDINPNGFRLTRKPTQAYPTQVQVEYTDASGRNWPIARQIASASGVIEGTSPRRISKISMPGIHTASQAKRLAVERLNWYLSDLECTLPVFDEGLDVQQGSVVSVTHPIGLDRKLFRVRRITGNSGRWILDLAEYDPAIYSDEVISDPTFPDTNLGDPLNPPALTNLAAVEELYTLQNGTIGSRARVTWDAPTYPFVAGYLVKGYVSGVLIWETTVTSNVAVSQGLEQLVVLDPVEVRIEVSVLTGFTTGNSTTLSVTILGKLLPPGDVPSLTGVRVGADVVRLSWGRAVDIDIWRYEIRMGTPSDTWESLATLQLTDSLIYTVEGVAVGSAVRFFVKAVDSVANESVNAITFDITLAEPTPVTSLTGFEIAGEVRLRWAAPDDDYVERYRVAYADIPETVETTLDITDSLAFSTKDVAEGLWMFKVYSRNALGDETDTPAQRQIEVTFDTDSFLADTYEFIEATLSNMVEYDLRTDDFRYYVTNMGDAFTDNPSSFSTYSAEALANYHTAGASYWLSETKDFLVSLTGNWVVSVDAVALTGTIETLLELSTDGVSFDQYSGGSAKGTYQYARVRIVTQAQPGTDTLFVMTPGVTVRVNVVPIEESGSATTLTSGGKQIVLGREYAFVKEVFAQPINSIDAVTAIVDNIDIGFNTGVRFDGTNYMKTLLDEAGLDMGTADFTIECWAKNDGSGTLSVMVAKRATSSSAGYELGQDSGGRIRLLIDDGPNAETIRAATGSFPEDSRWHHIAAVVDRGSDIGTIYIDGVDSTSDSDIAAVTGSLDNTAAFTLGARADVSLPYEGSIDDLRVWDSARTELQINQNKDIELEGTESGLLGYWKFNGPLGADVLTDGEVPDETGTNGGLQELLATAVGIEYVDARGQGNTLTKTNAFDVYVFDIFGQQIASDIQWRWKGV